MMRLYTIGACIVGSFLATLLFLLGAVYFFGDPFGDWFMSVHGIFVADKQYSLTSSERAEVFKLLNKGIIVSSDQLISNITNFYGNFIQVLLGTIALFGILSFFSIRWQSLRATEDFVDGKLEKKFLEFTKSSEFKDQINVSAEQSLNILREEIEDNPPFDLSVVMRRLDAVEQVVAERSSADEPTEDDGDENETRNEEE